MCHALYQMLPFRQICIDFCGGQKHCISSNQSFKSNPDMDPVILWQLFLNHSSSPHARLWNGGESSREFFLYFSHSCKNQLHQTAVAPEGITGTRSPGVWHSLTCKYSSLIFIFFRTNNPVRPVKSSAPPASSRLPLQRVCHGRVRRSSSRTGCSAGALARAAQGLKVGLWLAW